MREFSTENSTYNQPVIMHFKLLVLYALLVLTSGDSECIHHLVKHIYS